MSEIGLRTRMVVKDVMSSPVVTLDEDATSNKVADLMDENNLGCVIVTNRKACRDNNGTGLSDKSSSQKS